LLDNLAKRVPSQLKYEARLDVVLLR
jgi:hypothetical protein